MPDPTLEPGIQFFDDFTDNVVGTGVPVGWTLLAGQTPSIVADSRARGGRALTLDMTGVSTALGYTAAGSHTSVEVLVAIRTNVETGVVSPYPTMSGPGGRLQVDTSLPVGLGLVATTKSAYCFCGSLCRQALPYPRGTPNEGQTVTATVYSRKQQFAGFGLDSGYTQVGIVEVPMFSGVPVVGYASKTASTVVGPLSTAGMTGAQLADAQAKYPAYFTFVSTPSGQASIVGRHIVCGGSQNLFGDAVHEYSYMRLRTGPELGRIRGSWWKKNEVEPTTWMVDGLVAGNFYPDATGGMAGILFRRSSNDSGLVYFDWVAISVDPDNFPAPTPDDTTTSECPLPDGTIGVEYEQTLDFDNLVEDE